jgi:hypothetical protein
MKLEWISNINFSIFPVNTEIFVSSLIVVTFSYLLVKSSYRFFYTTPPKFNTQFRHETSPEFTDLWFKLINKSQNILIDSKNSIPFISESNAELFEQAIRNTMFLDVWVSSNPSIFGLALWFLVAFCSTNEFLELTITQSDCVSFTFRDDVTLLPLHFFNNYLESLNCFEYLASDFNNKILLSFNSEKAVNIADTYLRL